MAKSIAFVAAALLLVAATALSAQEPTEASLIASWEQSRRADASTVLFEKVGEGRYQFKTKAFPFDGEIQVVGVSIGDPFAEDFSEGVTPGTVDVELVDFPEETAARYAAAVARWQAGNTLYFESDGGRWLTAREWRGKLSKKFGRWSWVGWISGSFWIVFLLLIAAFLWFVARKSQKQMRGAMAAQEKALEEQARGLALAERSVRLNEEANRLLGEILETLKAGESKE